MPRGLPSKAKRFWKDHADKLDALGLLTEVDGPAFTLMAIHYDAALQAAQYIKENGLADVDENGVVRKSPMLQVLRDNSTAFLRYAGHFGLTPSTRGKLQIPEPPAVDEIEAFLNG